MDIAITTTLKIMATPKQLHAALILFFSITNVVGDTITTSVTTFDAASCAIPSCTITPASLTSDITIQPTPTTIFVPGHVLPLVFTFDRVTLDAFQPEPTILRNDGTGTLTLGTTTLTDLPSASATRSYTVDIAPDVTLKAVVSVAVQAEAPLFIDRQHDSNDACELFPELGRRSARKRITGRRLRVVKREPIPIRVSPDMGAGIIEPALAAARKVLTAIRTYFDGVSAADVPDNLGLAKWLPETIPGTGQPTFDRIIQTVRALLRFLDENENEDARFVVTTGEGTKLLRSCTPGVAAVTFPGKTQQLSDTCTVEGWIIFCRTLLAWKMEERILVDEVKPDEKPEGLPFLCSDQDFRKKLDENRFELGVSWGSLGKWSYY